MKVTMSIPDETYEAFQKQVKGKGEAAVRDEILARIERFKDVPPSDRVLVLKADERRQLERLFQTSVTSAADLISKVRKLCSVTFGSLEIPFTYDEMVRLRTQASFHGWEPEAFVTMVSNELKDRFFDRF